MTGRGRPECLSDEDLAALADADGALGAAARLLDLVAASAEHFWDLETEMQRIDDAASETGQSSDSPGRLLLAAARDAARYLLSFEEGRVEFRPEMEFPGGESVPVRVEAQSADVLQRWRLLDEAVTDPIWRSRLGHLVVAAGTLIGKDRVTTADDAVAAYLLSAGHFGPDIEGVEFLRAALGLARQFGLNERRDETIAALVDLGTAALAKPKPWPGVVLGITEVLVNLRDAPDAVDDLLNGAATVFADDIFQLDSVVAQRLKRSIASTAR